MNMREEGVSPNDRTFMSVLQACGIIATVEGDVTLDGRSVKVEAITKGKAIHAHAQMKGNVQQRKHPNSTKECKKPV